jgi:hypothetical protein
MNETELTLLINQYVKAGCDYEDCLSRFRIEIGLREELMPEESVLARIFANVHELHLRDQRAEKSKIMHFAIGGTPDLPSFPLSEQEGSKHPHWFEYKGNLIKKGFSQVEINSIEYNAGVIVESVLNVKKSNAETIVKGLVLGHVQSGKTASMAAVMALAADRGFDLVFVLSGIHNALNMQTSLRFEQDLGTYNSYSAKRAIPGNYQNHKNIKLHAQQYGLSWDNLTPPKVVNDEVVGAMDAMNRAAPMVNVHPPAFGVVKKNPAVLRHLIQWIKSNHMYLTGMRMLVIDDECDQASPNTADITNQDEKTVINRLVNNLINNDYVKDVTYVGYTATPFANILNEPPGPKSLYPEHFIHALPKPSKHFGSMEFFGAREVGSDTLAPMTILIPDLPAGRGVREVPEDHVETLRSAIAYYACTCAARFYSRGITDRHATMLVHTSSRVDDHELWADKIVEILNEFRENPKLFQKLAFEVWNKEWKRLTQDRLEEIFGLDKTNFSATESFDSIRSYLGAVLDGGDRSNPIVVRVDNSRPGRYERLYYKRIADGTKPDPIIVVGGNTLSRGLTLDGLTVSYFARTITQADSLMQMGRWFGYRPGYEDLVRVWTTSATLSNFEYVCELEADLREQIKTLYEESDFNPSDVALTVMTSPQMNVVRKNAMQAARNKAAYFGNAPQTYYFHHKNAEWLNKNWNVASKLLSGLKRNTERSFSVSLRDVTDFLGGIQVHPYHYDSMNPMELAEFIQNANKEGYLLNWHAAVAAPLASGDGTILDNYTKIVRTRMKGINPSYPDDANIKALRSPGDLFMDFDLQNEDEIRIASENSPAARMSLMNRRQIQLKDRPGLILLYPITPIAKDHRIPEMREDLGAVAPVLGWSIVFPTVAGREMKSIFGRIGILI